MHQQKGCDAQNWKKQESLLEQRCADAIFRGVNFILENREQDRTRQSGHEAKSDKCEVRRWRVFALNKPFTDNKKEKHQAENKQRVANATRTSEMQARRQEIKRQKRD